MNYNKVILMGRLTKDIELRYTSNGTAVASSSLAVNPIYEKEGTLFIDVTFWGKTAENCAEYLSTGSPILVDGRLKLDTWETDAGQKRRKITLVASQVKFLYNKRQQNEDKEEEDHGEAEEVDEYVPF